MSLKQWIQTGMLCVLSGVMHASYAHRCADRHFNPLKAISWGCLGPITIAGKRLGHYRLPDLPNPKRVGCVCTHHHLPRVGVVAGFWEPVALVEVVRHPFCFFNTQGMRFPTWAKRPKGMVSTSQTGNHHSFYYVHWYPYPMTEWPNVFSGLACFEDTFSKTVYLSEFDPTWNQTTRKDSVGWLTARFAKPKAQLACAGACVKANMGLPSDALFWCAGCQGSMFPLNGHVQNHVSGAQASALLVQRVLFKLHRYGLLQGTYGKQALCHAGYPMPVLHASQYRYQMVYPRVTNCQPLGRSVARWPTLVQQPVVGEDFAYIVWRKRNCCLM